MSNSIKYYSLGLNIKEVLKPGPMALSLHFYSSRISAGYPSPGDDHVERTLDLNEHLIAHPAATFFLRVVGDSMTGVGIQDNDILVVDRSIEPTDGRIVIAVVSGEMTVKRLRYRGKSVVLVPENPLYSEITLSEDMDFSVWGVVTSVIHQF